MPSAPPRACATCGKPNCTAHKRQPWQHARPVRRVLLGVPLQRARLDLYVAAHGCCAACHRLIPFESMIRDHVRPLAEGGQDVVDNTQALCETCHDQKTQQEAARGARVAT